MSLEFRLKASSYIQAPVSGNGAKAPRAFREVSKKEANEGEQLAIEGGGELMNMEGMPPARRAEQKDYASQTTDSFLKQKSLQTA